MIEYTNFKCGECGALFRITVLSRAIEYVACPSCGDNNCDYMPERLEEEFESEL